MNATNLTMGTTDRSPNAQPVVGPAAVLLTNTARGRPRAGYAAPGRLIRLTAGWTLWLTPAMTALVLPAAPASAQQAPANTQPATAPPAPTMTGADVEAQRRELLRQKQEIERTLAQLDARQRAQAPATQPAATRPSTQPSHPPPATAAAAPFPSTAALPPAATQLNVPASQSGTTTLHRVLVTADLDATREQIAPSLGAVTYTIGLNQIQSTGQGENATFQQVLLHSPGVVQEEFGEVHIRGDHGDLQYRVNGVLLPEGLNGFGQEIDTRLMKSVTLMTGTLPAQFGDRTAGVIDITTKTGSQLNGGELSFYGGSYGTIQPSLSLGGVDGRLEYFVSGSFKQNDLGIDNTTASPDPIHDTTDQERAFGYFSYLLTDTSRVTLLLSGSYANFQIPDTAGLSPLYKLAGNPPANSALTNENQNEQNYYAVVSYQATFDNLSFQVSGFTRDTQIHFKPDQVQDLLFGGVAGQVNNSDVANGVQADGSYTLGDDHTLRGGLLLTYENEMLNTNTAVFPITEQFSSTTGPFSTVPAPGTQTSTHPFDIISNSGNSGLTSGFYLQDEWRLNKALTMNYGLRYDRFDTDFDHEDQLSPRINLVWKIDKLTTAHAGYARYFMPPTLQYVSPSIGKEFQYTSNAPFNDQDDSQKCERDHYFDVGLSRQITPSWQVTADSFCKFARNLLDDGQFGSAVILNNFNYTKGFIYGAELSTTYQQGPFSTYGNFSYVETAARNVDSAQFEFPNNELNYISENNIQLDHQQLYTASAGVAYTFQKNTRVYADLVYGDGLRAGFANLEKLPAYYPVNIGVEHAIHLSGEHAGVVKVRVDCLNVFDEVYELRNGSGLGIAAPAYGPRRGVFGGISYEF